MGFLAIIIAYLLGSIPFGYIFTLLARRIDIRQYGSGNIGATNVQRLLGWRVAFLVLLLDLGKGSVAVLLARAISGETAVILAAALAVLLGHCYPIFLQFKGGKGAATGVGLLLALSTPVCAATVALAVLIIALTPTFHWDRSSVPFRCPFLLLFFNYEPLYLLFGAAMALLIIFRHRENIVRLLKECRIEAGAKSRKAGLIANENRSYRSRRLGTAQRVILANKGYPLLLGAQPCCLQKIILKRVNEDYLPGVKLPDTIRPTTDLEEGAMG